MAGVTLRTAQIASHIISVLSLNVITSDYVSTLARQYSSVTFASLLFHSYR